MGWVAPTLWICVQSFKTWANKHDSILSCVWSWSTYSNWPVYWDGGTNALQPRRIICGRQVGSSAVYIGNTLTTTTSTTTENQTKARWKTRTTPIFSRWRSSCILGTFCATKQFTKEAKTAVWGTISSWKSPIRSSAQVVRVACQDITLD